MHSRYLGLHVDENNRKIDILSFCVTPNILHLKASVGSSIKNSSLCVAQSLHNLIGEAIDVMVPDEVLENQEATDSLPKEQSKSSISQLDHGPGMVASTNVPEVLTASDTVMSPASNSEAVPTELPLNVHETLIGEENNKTNYVADAILDQEFPEKLASPFPDSAATLDVQGFARSDQGAQGTLSAPSSLVPGQNMTTAAESGPQVENQTSRAASLVNHSVYACEAGVQPPNISYSRSTVNTSAYTSLPNNPMRQRPQIYYRSFNDICDHELEKLSREQGALRKNFEETTSELKAELERMMAEARSEYDRKLQEVDAAYNAQAKKEEARRSLVVMNSLLANTFKFDYLNKNAATDTAAVRARSPQHSMQQQQEVQTYTHMNSIAPPRPSVTAAEAVAVRARSSQHSMQQQQEVQTNTHMNSTAPPRPSVTAAEAQIPFLSGPLMHIPCRHTTQPRPISQQEAMQSKTDMNPTTIPRTSVTFQQTALPLNPTTIPRTSVTLQQTALPLHSPLSNTRQPRALPLIPNHNPSSYSAASSPPVHGVVRAMAPHLRSSRTLNPAGASTTSYPTSLVQEQQQQPQQRMTREHTPQQENLNNGFVYVSDDDK